MFNKIIFYFKKCIKIAFFSSNTKEQNIINSKNKIKYILKNWIFLPFLFGIIFSIPIYINIFTYQQNAYFPYINSIFVLLSISIFINIDKKFRFFFGFFIGILWFYWIGFSFRFTDAQYFMYITIIFVAIIYGIVFWFALLFNNKIFRAITLSFIGYLVILGFNWFVPDAMLAFSIFKVDKFSFVFIVMIITIISIKKLKQFRFLALFLLIFAVDFNTKQIILPETKIKITQTNIAQETKWDMNKLNKVIKYNLELIQDAINKNYDIVVLPETTFPIILNKPQNSFIMNEILHLSKKIVIIAGAQRIDEFGHYNSTYIFKDGIYEFADKVFLAPFGEYAPIPSFLIDIFSSISGINYAEFDIKNAHPNDIDAKYIIFRNAICYEATTREIYEDSPKFVLSTSNNAWFKPSMEPVLQMTLIKYYARMYNTIVFHSANGSNSGIITPNTNLDFYAKKI